MEISPAKSLGIVSDSEGEGEHAEITMDAMFEREVNAARSSDPRDWPHFNQPATIATNLSSNISQFNTLPGQAATMQTASSAISDFDSPATNARPRARPRMRPVPPPDQASSIDAFPTFPTTVPSAPETVASFNNSMVQGVPIAGPPSLPPSSLPGPDSSSSMPIPTFPTSKSPLRPLATPLIHEVTTTSSSVMPPAPGSETAPIAPKRARPKMRPPPPPEPEVTPVTATTTSSSAIITSSSAEPNTASTGATSVSSTNKSNPSRTSALDDAEEYRGRGARRITQPSKPTLPCPPPDADVDVGGPEDNNVNDIIMLISSDDEYGGSKAKAKAKPKPKPKPRKKDASKTDSTDIPGEQIPPAKTASKSKRSKLLSSDDEFGKWDTTIPGGSAPTERRNKAGSPNEGGASVQPVISTTIDPPNPNPADGSGYRRATSSPLSSPGRSPERKRKDPPKPAAGETTVPSPIKKARKSGFVGVVLTGPSSDGKKPKRAKKKSAKATALEDDGTANDQAYVPPALSSVADTSTSVAPSESAKTKTTPPTSSGPSMVAPEPEIAMDVDAAPVPAKKQSKKRAPKGKKATAAEESVTADGSAQEDPAPKKGAKGKGKGKGKQQDETPTSAVANDEATGASSSNPDAGAVQATSSNPSSNNVPQPTSSNPSAAPTQTPAPKPKPKPRHSTTSTAMPVAMGASGALLRSASGKSTERPLSETIRNALGVTGSPAPRMGLSRRGSSKITPLLAFRGAPPPPPPPMPKKPTKKKKGDSDDEDSEEGPEWEGLTEKQKEKKRREKEMAGWYSDG